MKLPDLPKCDEMPRVSVQELAKSLYGEMTFDTALPQGWVNECSDKYDFDPRGNVVWGYPKSSVWGVPLPMNQEAMTALNTMGYDYEVY